MPRGVRVWNRANSGGDLFPAAPPPPAPIEVAAPAIARKVPTDADCRRKDRALRPFLHWLLAASIKTLEAADAKALARKYPPIEEWDIAQMIEVHLAAERRKARR